MVNFGRTVDLSYTLLGTNAATLRSSYMLYQFRPSVRPSVRHTGGLWPHRSTDRNNLGIVQFRTLLDHFNVDYDKAVLPGWNTSVFPLHEKQVFWHNIWVKCGRPHDSIAATFMRFTRAAYH